MTDAERLDAIRAIHDTWGDTQDADIDVQELWEEIGMALGSLLPFEERLAEVTPLVRS